MKLPLTGGFYLAKSIIAGAQRCVNLYAEKNRPDAPFPFTTYDRPGLTRQARVSDLIGQWRGLYTATNGQLFGVCGATVYYIDRSFVLTSLGTISTLPGGIRKGVFLDVGSGYSDGTYTDVALTGGTGRNAVATVVVSGGAVSSVTFTNTGKDFTIGDQLAVALGSGSGATYEVTGTFGPVSFSDNRLVIVLVDGSTAGYTIDPTMHTLATISDPGFYGADRVDYLDTYFTFNRPATNQWYISPSEWDGIIAFDLLDIATKTGAPDGISTVIVNNRNVWLLGDQESAEVWYNVGKPDFTFERMPGVIVNHGCAAAYSAAWYSDFAFWLGVDPAGNKFAMVGTGYQAKVISPPAVQNAWTSYAETSDAIGFTVQFEGHALYILTFPTADKTWAFDIAESEKAGEYLWYEWMWQDEAGQEHRWRPNCHAFAYGVSVVGDWENGCLYTLDEANYTDNDDPIVRRRGFPHLIAEGDRISVKNVIANMQVGASTATTTDEPALVSLGTSVTGGASWRNPVLQSLGSAGQYATSAQWNQLGMGRDWVFELFWDFPFKTALGGLYIDADKLGS